MQVVWLQSAMEELARLWLAEDAPTRKTITAAVHQIDTAIQFDPWLQGESRTTGERVYFVSPLGVLFKINIRLQQVVIISIWQFRLRGK